MVEAARRGPPEAVSCATNGNGTMAHLVLAQMQGVLGVQFLHVPYPGGGPLATAAAGNQTDIAMGAAALSGHVASGLVRALAQTGARRSAMYPDLPTLAESGVPGIDAVSFLGALAPAATPEPILRRFREALISVVEAPATKARLRDGLGFDLALSEPRRLRGLHRGPDRGVAAGGAREPHPDRMKDPTVTLSLDNGPVPEATPDVLVVLRSRALLATLFVPAGLTADHVTAAGDAA